MKRLALAAVLAVLAAGVTATGQAPGSARAVEPTADKFKCGFDATVQEIPVRPNTVVLAGDGRFYMPCPLADPHLEGHREVRERVLLERAKNSTNPDARWRAVQAYVRQGLGAGMVTLTAVVTPVCNSQAQIFGGIVNPMRWQAGELFRLVRHADPLVRRQAAYGLGVALSRPNLDANVATAARKELESCLRVVPTTDIDTRALLIEAIGLTRYGNDDDRAEAARTLVSYSKVIVLQHVLAAAKGFEALIRQAPGWEVGLEARVRLRELVIREPPGVAPGQVEMAKRIRRLAMMALQAARDADIATLDRAANDRDWQVRRLVAMMLTLTDADQARIGDRLEDDPAFQVRYDYLSALSRHVTQTRVCAPIVKYLGDIEPLVAMRAMDVVNARCTDLDDAVEKLKAKADLIGKGDSHEQWHLPARAMGALARVRPAEAKAVLPDAIKHPVWQVRAQAATSAVTMGLIEEAVTLARDSVPNVQTAAIDALARAKNPAVVEPAIDVLQHGADFQVLRSAANAMNNIPDDARSAATEAMLSALRRLTELGEDPSRDPRVAILAALGRVMRRDRSNELLEYTNDVDDEVNTAAAKAFEAVTGAPPPPNLYPYRRYPFQPAEAALSSLPGEATIQLEHGVVVLQLLRDEAPVTIARFVALVKAGYYTNLTFHRIVPNFVVQGGSPGASEYVGTARFMRDEVGPSPHLRGAVGISTRGRDTGDAQIFIDLVDIPRLDRDYTVFGYVLQGMEYVDRMLEGARIKGITVK